MRVPALALLVLSPISAQLPKPNSGGVSMGHLHIVTQNVAGHRKLWIDTLGGKLVKAGPVEFAMFPDVLVGIREGKPTAGTDDSVVNHLGFKVKDLDSTKKKLTENGASVVREMPDTRQMFIMFPDGVKVEFTEDKGMTIPIAHHHVHFQSHQQDEMRAWYAETFGAVPGMRGRFKAADLPGVNLSWNPADKPMVPTKGRSLDHIGFEIKGLEAFCKKLESKGVKFDRPYTKLPNLGLEVAFFTDPWGTYIELTEGLGKY